jgi:multidrug resistance efflux pump
MLLELLIWFVGAVGAYYSFKWLLTVDGEQWTDDARALALMLAALSYVTVGIVILIEAGSRFLIFIDKYRNDDN